MYTTFPGCCGAGVVHDLDTCSIKWLRAEVRLCDALGKMRVAIAQTVRQAKEITKLKRVGFVAMGEPWLHPAHGNMLQLFAYFPKKKRAKKKKKAKKARRR